MAKSPKLRKVTSIAPMSLTRARQVAEQTDDAQAWKKYGGMLLNQGQSELALEALQRAFDRDPNDPFILSSLGFVHHKSNNPAKAMTLLQQALDLDPEHVQGLVFSGIIEQEAGRRDKALAFFERAEALSPTDDALLRNKAITLSTLARYDEALVLLEQLLVKNPNSSSLWNDAANIRRDLGDFDGLDEYFEKAIKLAGDNPVPFSNRLTYIHYDPAWSREAIFDVCKEWQQRYAPRNPPARPVPENLDPGRRLRLGLFSDGFRNHPVGTMIVEALERLNRQEVELYFYPSHNDEDHLTQRLRRLAASWLPIKHLSNEDFNARVRSDKIDILFDLSGHNSGTRSRAVALQPAPLLVKWVGGLINTTGIEAMDYLLSDSVETPPGDEEDALFTEKLIRLPDDYIVFSPPRHTPPIAPLPAEHNGYITLGCFNNPTKINPATLREWAKLMHQLPDSRLFLKSKPYASESFRQRIIALMAAEGIVEERLIIEGPAHHRALLEAYNRVDIALDPWPYSGGLTTCEAMLMGVPVVTLPGPTFAGRHSATHLTNAGMPELVVNNWEEYHARVIELASDLDSLATIRLHLRDILLQSPVCDGKRFARHLMVSIRAIWQRYCEGKAPATLTFNKDGQAWFKGENDPIQVEVAEPESSASEGFNWELSGKLMALDTSARLLSSRSMQLLLHTKAFALVAFDPRSIVIKPEQYEGHATIQLVPHALLGDGKPATLHACLDPTLSSTLEPLPAERLPEHLRLGAQVLTRLPISTLALDSIEGLGSLDWLLLDELSDAAAILEHGGNTLHNSLLIEARIQFQPTHQGQPSLDEIIYWAGLSGFRFYHLGRMGNRSHLPTRPDLKKKQSTELVHADALFIPNQARMAELSNEQRIKLAFLLHTIYGIRDLSYALLADVRPELAESYLRAEGFIADPQDLDKPIQSAPLALVPKQEAPEVELPDAPFMSEKERELFDKSLSAAKNYFEFGAGGSTIWAVRKGLTAYGIESDAQWVNALKRKLGDLCQVKALDIGPTGAWGFPSAKEQHQDKFPAYSKAIHEHSTLFDLILVDGRFRVACAMAAILHVLNNAPDPSAPRLFIHDFWNRPHYHAVLQFLDVVEQAETAGVFKIKADIEKAKVEAMWEQYAKEPA